MSKPSDCIYPTLASCSYCPMKDKCYPKDKTDFSVFKALAEKWLAQAEIQRQGFAGYDLLLSEHKKLLAGELEAAIREAETKQT